MFKFSSDRERKLWISTLVVVAGIYGSLGLTATLAGVISNQTLSAVLFLAGMVMVGLAVLALGLRIRPKGIEIGLIVGMIVVYMFALFRMTIPERSHLIEYSVVAGLILEALKERKNQGWHVPLPSIQALIAAAGVGVVDELIQFFLPKRVFDPVDIFFNASASLLAIAALLALDWVRDYSTRRQHQ